MNQARNHPVHFGPLTLVVGLAGVATPTGMKPEPDRADDYHLLFNAGVPRHLPVGSNATLGSGEAVLLDAATLQKFGRSRSSGIVHICLPDAWIRSWVKAPAELVGVPMQAQSNWGAALDAFLAQLTPELILRGPVAPTFLAEQLGMLLALFEDGRLSAEARGAHTEISLRDQIWERLQQRCGDTSLTVHDIAQSLRISPRTLHRALEAHGESFGELLLGARIQVATRMLESPNLWRIPTAEIGRRAGFKDASHFAKTYRRLRGLSPSDMRREAQARSRSGETRR